MSVVDSIIGSIQNICYNWDRRNDRKIIHKGILFSIKKCLNLYGFNVYLEYPVEYESLKIRDKTKSVRKGYIDLVAVKNDIIIGIELDTGTHIKYKSIEKLLNENLTISIGIVKGSLYHKVVQENIDKIRMVGNILSKKIILILIEPKKLIWV